MIAVLVLAWALSLAVALSVGFRLSKRVPYSRTLREEIARRAGITRVYVQATLAVLSPRYRRRWERQREEARRAYRDNLVTIEREEWARGEGW